MTEMNATGAPSLSFPPGRYGRRREPWRRRWWRQVLVAVLMVGILLAGAAVAVVLGQQYGTGRPYGATVVRFYDITDSQVVVEFTVVVPEGETAVCAVRARNAAGAEVGREEIRVDPPPGQRQPQVRHTLTTTERPVTGEVQRCWPDR